MLDLMLLLLLWQSVWAVNKDLTGGHYLFRECHGLAAFPWTAGPQRIVALSKFKHGSALLKCASVRNIQSLCSK